MTFELIAVSIVVVFIAELVRRLWPSSPPDYLRLNELERKASEYDALESIFDEVVSECNSAVATANNRAQQFRTRLDLAMRDVSGVREYIAAFDAESARAKAAAQTARTGRQRTTTPSTRGGGD